MSSRHIYTVHPYVLDLEELTVKRKTERIAALTKKNSDFIEAVVKIDSNYKRDMRNVPPHPDFDPENNSRDSDGKYCGSLTYWFTEMQKASANYAECVLGAVIAIDRGNSTHLEQVLDGRKKMRDRIIALCPDVKTLKTALGVPFTHNDVNHLISKMTEPGLKGIKDGNDRFFISFASKFCAYAALLLGTTIEYSKFDDVVSDNLFLYAQAYCGLTFNKSYFKINQIQGGFDTKRSKGLEIYEIYQQTIEKIISSLAFSMTRSELDHIIWYYEKGK